MQNLEYKNYFISRLKENCEFKVCYITTDSSRHLLVGLNAFNETCHIDIYDNLSSFIFKNNNGVFKRKYMNQNYADYDLIILDDSNQKNIDWELKYIEDMSIKISQTYEKQITIGYIFNLPYNNKSKGSRKQLKMANVNQNEIIYDEEIPIENANVCNVLDIISCKHDYSKKPKIFKK